MSILNSREIAIAIWLAVLTAWIATKPSVREAFGGVLANRLILIPLGVMAAYIGLTVFVLYAAGFWDVGQLKNTIIWSVSVAAVSLFRITKIADDPHYYKNAIKDNLKLVAVLEFIVTFYTFPLWAELIVVPVATLLLAAQTYAELMKEHAPAAKLLGTMLAFIGAALVTYAGYKLTTDFSSFAKPETLTDFALPPALSLLFLPFLFLMALYVSYETVFIRLQFAIKEPGLRAFAMRRAIIGFHVRTGLLKRWARNLIIVKPAGKQAVIDSIREVKALSARERNPENVPFDRGWPPYRARDFLASVGLHPGDYHRATGSDDEWYASSPYLEIGEGLFPDNIAYYIEGDEFTATTLKLVLNVNQPQAAQQARQKFTETTKLLFAAALNAEIPEDIESHLSSETDITAQLHGKEILIAKEVWPGHQFGGYTVKAVIRNPAASGSGGDR